MVTLKHTTVYITKDFTETWDKFKEMTPRKRMEIIRGLIKAYVRLQENKEKVIR